MMSRYTVMRLTRMASALDLWIRDTGDQGEEPEDPAIAEAWEERMSQVYVEAYATLAAREAPWK